MLIDACQWRQECKSCHALLKKKYGDCCVFCAHGTVPCLPLQAAGQRGCS